MIWLAKVGKPAVISTQVSAKAVAWFVLSRRHGDGTLTPVGQRLDATDPDSDAIFQIPDSEGDAVYELRVLPAAQHTNDIPWSMRVMQNGKILRAYNYQWQPGNGTKSPFKPIDLPKLKSTNAKIVSFDIWFE